jgi:hypothetical protein
VWFAGFVVDRRTGNGAFAVVYAAHQAASADRAGNSMSCAAVIGIGCSRSCAASSTLGQYFAGMPRRGQWIARAGFTLIASAKGLTPPKASMTSE